MQAPLALVGSLAAPLAWWLDRDVRWLVGGLLLFLVIPFTFVVIFPTNGRLESPGLDVASEEAVRLLRRWGWLHAVRSVLGGFSFAVFYGGPRGATLFPTMEMTLRLPKRKSWLGGGGQS